MKFLKTSIVVLFILSFSSAVLSLYLSNIRENEKEKRIYLEGVKTDLEGRLATVESDKARLSNKVTQLEFDNKALEKKLKQEQDARQQALRLVSEKDADLENLRGEANQAQFAFKDAQKRNQELERILDELETRMRQIEGQNELPGSEVGYLEVKPVVSEEAVKKDGVGQFLAEEKTNQAPDITFKPLTNLPEPPKKRRFFPFLSSSNNEKPDSKVQETKPVPNQVVPVETMSKIKAVSQAVDQAQQEPVQVKAQAVKEPVQKTDQTIAAGNVLLVNRKYNFVVVNLGSRQSLNLNDIVSIQQEGSEIAKARVEKVYDDYSAAYIVEEQSDHPIAEGNAVARV